MSIPTLAVSFAPESYVRDGRGNLNGPYDTAAEAVMDHLDEFPSAVRVTIGKLLIKGFRITNWYADGLIRMEEQPEVLDGIEGASFDNLLFTFIRLDGTATKLHSWASVRAVIDLRENRPA